MEAGEQILYIFKAKKVILSSFLFFPQNESFQSTGEFCNRQWMIKLKLYLTPIMITSITGHKAQLRLLRNVQIPQ